MEKDIDRKLHMINLLKKYTLDFELITAIEGKKLKDIDKYINLNKLKCIENINRELTPGEIGCILSHQLIYKKILDENITYALILEDDINLNLNINILKEINFEELTFDTLLLGYSGALMEDLYLKNTVLMKINNIYSICKLKEQAYGTYGYIVSLNGAKKLLKQTSTFTLPIDHHTGNYKSNKVLIFEDQLIFVNKELSDKSTITEERNVMEAKYKLMTEEKIIKAAKDKYKTEFAILEKKLTNFSQNIIIYGFNELGYLIYKLNKSKVSEIIDKNRSNQKIDDKIIKAKIEKQFLNDSIIVICAINPIFISEIKNNISTLYKDTKIISL